LKQSPPRMHALPVCYSTKPKELTPSHQPSRSCTCTAGAGLSDDQRGEARTITQAVQPFGLVCSAFQTKKRPLYSPHTGSAQSHEDKERSTPLHSMHTDMPQFLRTTACLPEVNPQSAISANLIAHQNEPQNACIGCQVALATSDHKLPTS
jgi:hypothetical protein